MLEELSKELEENSDWIEARAQIDTEGMKVIANILRDSLFYLIHTRELNSYLFSRVIKRTIYNSARFISRQLDDSGTSSILAQRTPAHFRSISFSILAEPLSHELMLVRELEIPIYMWNTYCDILERQKVNILEEIGQSVTISVGNRVSDQWIDTARGPIIDFTSIIHVVPVTIPVIGVS